MLSCIRRLEFGNVEKWCVYNNFTVLPGSSFKVPAPECMECKCTNTEMSCCGFGFAAGVHSAPAGCVAVNDACKTVLVKEDNPNVRCHQPGKKSKKPSSGGRG